MNDKATFEFTSSFLVKLILIVAAIVFTILMFKQMIQHISAQGIFIGLIIVVALIAVMDNIIDLLRKIGM